MTNATTEPGRVGADKKTIRAGPGGTEYKIERNGDNYLLHGPRGACYGLIRHRVRKAFLFVINLRTLGEVRGLGWFTDEGGELREVLAV